MTLRLTDAEAEVLRRRAEMERRPMQEVVRQAIREYVESHSRAELLDRVLEEEQPGTPRRWGAWRSDLPVAAGAAAGRRARPRE